MQYSLGASNPQLQSMEVGTRQAVSGSAVILSALGYEDEAPPHERNWRGAAADPSSPSLFKGGGRGDAFRISALCFTYFLLLLALFGMISSSLPTIQMTPFTLSANHGKIVNKQEWGASSANSKLV